MTVTCCTLHEYMCDFVGGELCAESCECIQAHLAKCPPCANLVAEYKITIEAGKCLPMRPVPPSLLDKIKRALGECG